MFLVFCCWLIFSETRVQGQLRSMQLSRPVLSTTLVLI